MKRDKRRRAFIRENMEYESNIHLFRIAQDLTIAELSRRAGVTRASISALANGSMSPLWEKSGKIKKEAQKLCEFFGVELYELFPRYACTLKRSFQHEIQPWDSYSEKMASGFVDGLIASEYVHKILLETALTEKEEQVLNLYFWQNMTIAEIGWKIRRSADLVRQRIAKALRKLRKILMRYDEEVIFPPEMLRA